jgi:hypothetical protein
MPDYIDQNIAAHHFDRKAVDELHLNENNPGLGYEHVDPESGIRTLIGAYRNSIRKNSIYALMGYSPLRAGDFSAGIVAGGVTGYDRPVAPAVGGLLSYDGPDYGANVVLVPNVPSKNVYGYAGLQMKYKLK